MFCNIVLFSNSQSQISMAFNTEGLVSAKLAGLVFNRCRSKLIAAFVNLFVLAGSVGQFRTMPPSLIGEHALIYTILLNTEGLQSGVNFECKLLIS